ncbi:MAG: purine-cytosine permease family protein [Rhizobacter sp.]
MTITTAVAPLNQALTPVAAADRVFRWNEHASLWFSLGVGLLVIQIGAYLVPAVGTREALLAIVAGSLIGSGLLAWTARLACNSGLSSAGLMHRTYGSAFARVPVLLNIVQLVGWTSFELVIMREGTLAISQKTFGFELGGLAATVVPTLLWGAVLTALMAGSMLTLVRRFVGRYGMPLVVASLLWLTWQFWGELQAKGVDAVWNRSGDGSMGWFSAMDLVIAMPVSWLPLVADYARHGRRGGTAFSGTWLGYAIANIWCYSLGVLIASTTEPSGQLAVVLLSVQGGLLAMGLILLDEIDNAYGDVYSGAVSAHSLVPGWSIRRWGVSMAIGSTLLAMLLPMHQLEPFLLMLSSVFVPLYGVILGRLTAVSADAMPASRVDPQAAGIWIVGIGAYHALATWAPQLGSALPTLALTFVLAWITRPRASSTS